jgi:membrane protein
MSRHFDLPTWNKPSFACLASRFPYGEQITREKLAMVDQGEQLLMDMGFKQFRVRIHGNVARIELLPEDFVLLESIRNLISDILTELYSGSVSLVSITLIAALWASSKAMHSLSYGFDVIFAVPETRNWFVLRFWAILYTSVFAIGILAFLALTLLWKPIQTWIDGYLPHLFFLLDPEIKWLILLSLLTLVFALMYQTFPAVNLHFRPMLPGALFAALGWMIFSNILGIYANDYNGFSMYGSLTTLAMGMFWLYICMYLVMLGAEINSVLLGTRNR